MYVYIIGSVIAKLQFAVTEKLCAILHGTFQSLLTSYLNLLKGFCAGGNCNSTAS